MRISGFDWDDGNQAKCARHGVTREEIEFVIVRAPRTSPDVAHSKTETRFIAIGRNAEARPIFVAFTIRLRDGLRLVRPISARYMHKKEIEAYDKACS